MKVLIYGSVNFIYVRSAKKKMLCSNEGTRRGDGMGKLNKLASLCCISFLLIGCSSNNKEEVEVVKDSKTCWQEVDEAFDKLTVEEIVTVKGRSLETSHFMYNTMFAPDEIVNELKEGTRVAKLLPTLSFSTIEANIKPLENTASFDEYWTNFEAQRNDDTYNNYRWESTNGTIQFPYEDLESIKNINIENADSFSKSSYECNEVSCTKTLYDVTKEQAVESREIEAIDTPYSFDWLAKFKENSSRHPFGYSGRVNMWYLRNNFFTGQSTKNEKGTLYEFTFKLEDMVKENEAYSEYKEREEYMYGAYDIAGNLGMPGKHELKEQVIRIQLDKEGYPISYDRGFDVFFEEYNFVAPYYVHYDFEHSAKKQE